MDCFSLNMPDFAYFPCMAATEAAMHGKYETPEIRYQTVFFLFFFYYFFFLENVSWVVGNEAFYMGLAINADKNSMMNASINRIQTSWQKKASQDRFTHFTLCSRLCSNHFFFKLFFLCVCSNHSVRRVNEWRSEENKAKHLPGLCTLNHLTDFRVGYRYSGFNLNCWAVTS